mgnify:CR=1 FL=1
MKKENKIYVIGHKNPDTDSICSAIAYADIKNRTENESFVAKRAGQINEETEYVLRRFGVRAPGYLPDAGTQVREIDIHEIEGVRSNISVKRAWEKMRAENVVTLPITSEDNDLQGLITVSDIASSYMDAYDSTVMSQARTQYRSIAETLDGQVIVGNEHGYFAKGKVLVGTANPQMLKTYIEEDDLIIMGDREEDHLEAIEQNVSCIIVGMGIEVTEKVIKLAHEKEIIIIMSPYDTFTIARLINQSIPVRYIMKTENLVTFNTEDFTDDIQNEMIKHRHRAFPVINKKGKCIGTISRRNFLDMHKKKVALVDHNEKDQAVDNIDKAEIVEIIDHHKLGSLETMTPISFRNQPVGCTATIVYQMYKENDVEITPTIAGLLCSAIISDTLLFRSPTCTSLDEKVAKKLGKIAGINLEEQAQAMFKAGSSLAGKTAEDICFQDFKQFTVNDMVFGVGQLNSMSKEELQEVKEMLTPYLPEVLEKNGVQMVFFMLTDILDESTELLCCGAKAKEYIIDAFDLKEDSEKMILKGVVSRKKQLIPTLVSELQQ